MQSLTDLLNSGGHQAWLFIPTAILLGALHGLEPGHSKTMMAAFIIAVRGTVGQAILLGLSAAISHSLLIWVLALTALHYGAQWNMETSEPYFQIGSAVMIFALAAWMTWRTRRNQLMPHTHEPVGPHGGKIIQAGADTLELEVFETNTPPRFRLHRTDGNGKALSPLPVGEVSIETLRPDGTRQSFQFAFCGEWLESVEEIPEPHAFEATLKVAHGDHAHAYLLEFSEEHDHHHHHEHEHGHHHRNDEIDLGETEDAHARAHAMDIQKRFANRNVTTSQIVVFGLTGGLMPCPAALTVLLVCLQLKRFALGLTLVLSFSFGLALTMVAAGTTAALGVKHASKRIQGFDKFASNAPYFSSFLLVCLSAFLAYQGWSHLR